VNYHVFGLILHHSRNCCQLLVYFVPGLLILIDYCDVTYIHWLALAKSDANFKILIYTIMTIYVSLESIFDTYLFFFF